MQSNVDSWFSDNVSACQHLTNCGMTILSTRQWIGKLLIHSLTSLDPQAVSYKSVQIRYVIVFLIHPACFLIHLDVLQLSKFEFRVLIFLKKYFLKNSQDFPIYFVNKNLLNAILELCNKTTNSSLDIN